jgi:hypothetical protein
MLTLWQDLRFGARMLLKKPGFTLTAVITLALGVGANTAIFTWLKAIILQPLPGVAERRDEFDDAADGTADKFESGLGLSSARLCVGADAADGCGGRAWAGVVGHQS